jgi:hypothetical protein
VVSDVGVNLTSSSPSGHTSAEQGQSALKDTFTHANLDHRYIGTGRLSGLPFMSSSFNARSAVLISRHLHASRVAVLRCSHRARAQVAFACKLLFSPFSPNVCYSVFQRNRASKLTTPSHKASGMSRTVGQSLAIYAALQQHERDPKNKIKLP